MDIARHLNRNVWLEWSKEKMTLEEFGQMRSAFFVRTPADKAAVDALFENAAYVEGVVDGELGFVTEEMSEAEFEEKAAKLSVRSVIRCASAR